MTATGRDRLEREVRRGWVPMFVMPVRDVAGTSDGETGTARAGRVHAVIFERDAVFVDLGDDAIMQLEPGEYHVLIWRLK